MNILSLNQKNSHFTKIRKKYMRIRWNNKAGLSIITIKKVLHDIYIIRLDNNVIIWIEGCYDVAKYNYQSLRSYLIRQFLLSAFYR